METNYTQRSWNNFQERRDMYIIPDSSDDCVLTYFALETNSL
jgi:hypothetical protein